MSKFSRQLICFLLSLVLLGGIVAVPAFAEDSEQSSISNESLAFDKAELVGKTVASENAVALMSTLSNNVLSNDYIEFAVDMSNGRFTIGTTGGNPDLSSDDNKKMLYGHSSPDTSYTTINVDGIPYIYGDDGFVTAPYFSDDSNVSEAIFGNIRVQQVISIVDNSSTLRDDVVEIKYIVTNEGTDAASFGLRIMMDTMLGSNDAAPFRIPGVGDVTTEMEFSGENIPQYWQAFDSLTDPTVVSYGNFLSGSIHPNKVQFTNWSRVYNNSWNYSISEGSSNGDSAVSVIWERTLAAGQTETYETRYGLSELLQDLQPPLGLTIASGSSVQIDSANNTYMPYTITAYVQNVGDATAENVYCTIELPDELEFADANETGVVYLGNMEVNELATVEKVVKVKSAPSASICTRYSVSVSADNASTKTLSKQLSIEALELGPKAIIIVHGIAGSRLYADEEVNTENYLKDLVSEFQAWPYNYYTFEDGHMLWEPQTYAEKGSFAAGTTHQNKVQSEIMMLLCDENGNSQIDISINDPSATEYGAQNTYEALVSDLVNTYSSTHEVRFFSYDWRMSNEDSAKALETFIYENNYSEVTLVCHSMGGIVASEYLSRSEENQQKVNKLITLGTPYLGAPKALYVFETGNFMDWLSNTFCMATPLKLISGNVYGIYQLLPDESYFTLNDTTYVKYYNNNGLWGKAYSNRLNYSETYDLLTGRDWATTSSGGVKKMLSTADDFYDGLFLADGSHVISTVDSYVVIGYGHDTVMEVVEEYNKNGSYKKCRDVTVLNGGDGTVPMISANIGGLSPSGHTYYVNEDHTGLVSNADVIELVKNIIDGNPDTYSSNITTTQPTSINSKGWFGKTKTTRIKLKLECPVTLSLLDESGKSLAYVSDNLIYNEIGDRVSFYVMGEDNDTKVAYLTEMENDLLLTGTDDGTMNYTVSLYDAGYEIQRIFFENVPISADTRIYTNTDLDNGVVLEVDEDNDGDIDTIIEPTETYNGTDLEEELEEHYHTCESPVFQWSDDHATCVAVFTCADDNASITLECEVVSETIPATHTEDGTVIYTASVVFEDTTYTDTATEVIQSEGHVYGEPEFSWSEDYASCDAVFTCVDGDGSLTVACTVTSETTPATETEDGQIVYTATVEMQGETYTDTRTTILEATGSTEPTEPTVPTQPVTPAIPSWLKRIIRIIREWPWWP